LIGSRRKMSVSTSQMQERVLVQHEEQSSQQQHLHSVSHLSGLREGYDAAQWGAWRSHSVLLQEAIGELGWAEKAELLLRVFRNAAALPENRSDREKKCLLSRSEFRQILRQYPCCEANYFDVFFDLFDRNQDDFISESDFLAGLLAVSPSTPHKISPDSAAGQLRMQFIFLYYDHDRNGKLEASELQRLVEHLLRIKNADTKPAVEHSRALHKMGVNEAKYGNVFGFHAFFEASARKRLNGTSQLLRTKRCLADVVHEQMMLGGGVCQSQSCERESQLSLGGAGGSCVGELVSAGSGVTSELTLLRGGNCLTPVEDSVVCTPDVGGGGPMLREQTGSGSRGAPNTMGAGDTSTTMAAPTTQMEQGLPAHLAMQQCSVEVGLRSVPEVGTGSTSGTLRKPTTQVSLSPSVLLRPELQHGGILPSKSSPPSTSQVTRADSSTSASSSSSRGSPQITASWSRDMSTSSTTAPGGTSTSNRHGVLQNSIDDRQLLQNARAEVHPHTHGSAHGSAHSTARNTRNRIPQSSQQVVRGSAARVGGPPGSSLVPAGPGGLISQQMSPTRTSGAATQTFKPCYTVHQQPMTHCSVNFQNAPPHVIRGACSSPSAASSLVPGDRGMGRGMLSPRRGFENLEEIDHTSPEYFSLWHFLVGSLALN